MSVKVMGWVWDLDLPRDQKFVLLAYADHADHEGDNVYPAISTIAAKTGYSERSIQRITRKLEESGYLILAGEKQGGRGKVNKYRIPIKGDKMTPIKTKRVTNGALKGDKNDKKGDIAVSPEPSLTVNEPSLKRGTESTAKDETMEYPAVIVYREEAHLTPNKKQREILKGVNYVDAWRETVIHWLGHNYNPRNISGMLDMYGNGCRLCKRQFMKVAVMPGDMTLEEIREVLNG